MEWWREARGGESREKEEKHRGKIKMDAARLKGEEKKTRAGMRESCPGGGGGVMGAARGEAARGEAANRGVRRRNVSRETETLLLV